VAGGTHPVSLASRRAFEVLLTIEEHPDCFSGRCAVLRRFSSLP